MTKKKKEGTKTQVLTAEDIFTGGELEKLEIPEIQKNGEPGVIYLKDPSAGDVMAFTDAEEGQRTEEILNLVTKVACDEDGEPIFKDKEDLERVREMNIHVFRRISEAVTRRMNVEADEIEAAAGNVSDREA